MEVVLYDPQGRGRSDAINGETPVGIDAVVADLECLRLHLGSNDAALSAKPPTWWAHLALARVNIELTIPKNQMEELMNVQGVGEKSFLKLKPLITVTPPKTDRAGRRSLPRTRCRGFESSRV
jgi:hypothetical protein